MHFPTVHTRVAARRVILSINSISVKVTTPMTEPFIPRIFSVSPTSHYFFTALGSLETGGTTSTASTFDETAGAITF